MSPIVAIEADSCPTSGVSRTSSWAWASHLDACGVERSPVTDDSYGSVIVFRDPDNIQLELMYVRGVW